MRSHDEGCLIFNVFRKIRHLNLVIICQLSFRYCNNMTDMNSIYIPYIFDLSAFLRIYYYKNITSNFTHKFIWLSISILFVNLSVFYVFISHCIINYQISKKENNNL